MLAFLAFMVLVQSLAFWLGQTQLLSQLATNAMLTFALYPINLFEGGGRFVLFAIIPAAFIGAVPAEYVRSASWQSLGMLILGAGLLSTLGTLTFYAGLRRYESGSAINVQV
jgi:ABC-2 type transport system permease protein